MNDDAPTYTVGFWVGLALGVPVIGYGILGVLDAFSGSALTSFVRYFVGPALVHDLLLAPVVSGIGWVLAGRLPSIAVAPVQSALAASGIVALVAWPFVRGDGATPGEPSFLSRDYAVSVLVTWAVIWGSAAAAVTARALSARRR